MATDVRSDGQTWIHMTFLSRGLNTDLWLWNISNMYCLRWCNRPFSHCWICMLTHFMSVVSVYNPCKHQNLRYFDVFREYTKNLRNFTEKCFLRTPRVAASESNTNCCQYELYTMKLLKYKTCKNSVCKEFNSNPTPFHFVCVIKTCFLTNKFNIIWGNCGFVHIY